MAALTRMMVGFDDTTQRAYAAYSAQLRGIVGRSAVYSALLDLSDESAAEWWPADTGVETQGGRVASMGPCDDGMAPFGAFGAFVPVVLTPEGAAISARDATFTHEALIQAHESDHLLDDGGDHDDDDDWDDERMREREEDETALDAAWDEREHGSPRDFGSDGYLPCDDDDDVW